MISHPSKKRHVFLNLIFIIIVLLFFSLQPVSTSYSDEYINPEDANKHIEEDKTVCGKVANTYYAVESKGQPTYLNLDKPWPDHIFTIVISKSDRHKFKSPPEIFFDNKRVCVTGRITTSNDKPQMTVSNASQIQLKSK
jgi:micrococcal nuclease